MKRREFITLLGGGTVAWPLATHAQQPAIPLIAFLSSRSQKDAERFLTAFRKGLAEAGYTEGQNVAIEYRWGAAAQIDRLPLLAADLVRRQPSVIAVGSGLALAQAVKASTATIPIIFIVGGDPVYSGLVGSLNRPGANITGISFLAAALEGKLVQVLHELVPEASTIGVLVEPNVLDVEAHISDAQSAARTVSRESIFARAGREGDIEGSFTTLIRRGAGCILISPSPLFSARIQQIAELATRHAIPAISWVREFPQAGGLVSYGSSQVTAFHEAGIYAGRILHGAKPGDLPVVQATAFELVINLKTARKLGLNIPLPLIGRADEVIE